MSRQIIFTLSALLIAACGVPQTPAEQPQKPDLANEAQRFSSNQATLMVFEFTGELYAPGSVWNTRSAIDEQMLYTIGHLNWNRSVGRLDTLQLGDIQKVAQADGTTKVTYRAKLEVAWASKSNLPQSYTFTLPRNTGSSALAAFTEKYSRTCVDWGAHDVDAGSMWYYYRPQASGCTLAAEDVVKVTATTSVSAVNTTGKYPEFHKIWEDDALEVVAIFGKYEDGATTSSDAGIAAYNKFVAAVKSAFAGSSLKTVPASFPYNPGVGTPDISFEAKLAGGKTVKIAALLVDNVRTAPHTFYARYEALTPTADVIMYNGHAGLGSNVRALAREGKFVPGKYLVMFMNGCDTFAYVDGHMAQTRATLNPDDPTGSKYMEIVTNAMPSFFHSMPGASMALIKALMKHESPVTYDKMFTGVDNAQVIVVTGEEDNVYYPGYDPDQGGGGELDMKETGFAAKGEELRYETPELSAGTYTFTLAHNPAHPGGDADLYVKVGSAPSQSSYDCRPYKSGSNEVCEITLTTTAKVFVTVVGFASTESHFVLTGTGSGDEGDGPAPFEGLEEQGTVTKDQEARFQTALVPAGRYTFTLSGTGDADLYVRAGQAPTTGTWDCRPYQAGSEEQCVIELSTPDTLHVMVRGWNATSDFRLVGASN